MKFGARKPNLKSSFKARTTGRLKRSAKRAIIPGYGRKGIGIVRNPKKALYNTVYKKTSIDSLKSLKNPPKSSRKITNYHPIDTTDRRLVQVQPEKLSAVTNLIICLMGISFSIALLLWLGVLKKFIASPFFMVIVGVLLLLLVSSRIASNNRRIAQIQHNAEVQKTLLKEAAESLKQKKMDELAAIKKKKEETNRKNQRKVACLKWLQGKPIIDETTNLPKSLSQYSHSELRTIQQECINNGMLKLADAKTTLQNITLAKLKNIAKHYSIIVKGSKESVINDLITQLTPEQTDEMINMNGVYTLTFSGLEFINQQPG